MQEVHIDSSSQRKDDHITLAQKSLIKTSMLDQRFFYEPMLSAHPQAKLSGQTIFGKTVMAPFWISSMTGGSDRAHGLNRVLAKMANKYKIGMGLGSCRCLIDNSERFDDFNLRGILGDDLPFFANIGIAQLEEINLNQDKRNFFLSQIRNLGVDGLIIHVNPLQEWLQPEGDRFSLSPVKSISNFIEHCSEIKIIVKEVGQGFGPRSMKEILRLPIAGIEFASFGGTNFSRLEMLRGDKKAHQSSLAFVGHSVEEMIGFFNSCDSSGVDVILSGGVTNFLDGYYYQQLINANSVIGMAGEVLKYALQGEIALDDFIAHQVEGYKFASQFLTTKGIK